MGTVTAIDCYRQIDDAPIEIEVPRANAGRLSADENERRTAIAGALMAVCGIGAGCALIVMLGFWALMFETKYFHVQPVQAQTITTSVRTPTPSRLPVRAS